MISAGEGGEEPVQDGKHEAPAWRHRAWSAPTRAFPSPTGSSPADVVPVRIVPELKAAIEARAETDHTTTSEVILQALRKFLKVA